MISQRLSLNMPRLNQNQRIQALTMLARGDNVSNVSRAFGCHRNTIIRLRERFQQRGGVADRRRPGRSRVTNPRTDRFIKLTHLRRRFQTATSSARQYGISKQTVLRRLRQARQPIQPRRPYVGQVLTAHHWAARLQWAQRHFRWKRQQWSRVLFSDESRFNLSHHDGRIRVFRRRGERFADNCLRERDRFGGGSVMVWGGIMGRRKKSHCCARPRSPYVGQVVTARHWAARLQWAQRHFRWERQQWSRVLFSDESRFNLSHHDGRIRVFRRRGERFADNCLIERDRFGGGSVMVWGGIMGRRKKTHCCVRQPQCSRLHLPDCAA